MDARGQQFEGSQGSYTLLTLLAVGGMAEIWLARLVDSRRQKSFMVVKKILPGLAREQKFLEMFLDEAGIASLLTHPNVVRTYEVCVTGDDHFIVMEYLEGESLSFILATALEKEHRLPPELAAAIMARVCDGLDHAHGLRDAAGRPLNIIHRDVSPQNIIVLFSGGVKVVDFGIAKAESKMHETRTGVRRGKLSYMSPEQSLGKKMDARADIFSLGTVFWEVLAHRRLFKYEREMDTLQAIAYGKVPPARQYRPGVPVELEAIAFKALEKDPNARFQTAGEMAAALRGFQRTSGGEVSERQISAFCDEVLAGWIQNKRQLLRTIEQAQDKPGSTPLDREDSAVLLPQQDQGDFSDEDETVVTNTSTSPGSLPSLAMSEDETQHTNTRPTQPTQPTGEHPLEAPSGSPSTLRWFGLVLVLGALVGGGLIAYDLISSQGEATTINGPRTKPIPPTKPAVDAGADTPAAKTPEPVEPDPGYQATQPRPKEPAILNLQSRPAGCRVTLDGKRISGRTPLRDIIVEPDQEHLVSVLCAKQRKAARKFTAGPGQQVDLTLRTRPPKPSPKQKHGFLRFNTRPWTDVYLGKRKLGMTPLVGIKLPEGRHTLRVVNPKEGIKATVQVVIQAGKTTSLVKKYNPKE